MAIYGLLLCVLGWFSISYGRKSFLLILLSMEMVMLGCFIIITLNLSLLGFEMLVFYLVMVVCEAGLGLSLLIVCIYFYSEDLVTGSSFLEC